ncbi:MAG: GNAT family N-acetyltransferase [Deltaproteobacteria bacterium]|nr:GNAT family N-acetyltransferase [Deltaproteobacteria bacterium]
MRERALITSFPSARFAIRPAAVNDAVEIAHVQTSSWQTSYRGILPDSILDTMNAARRVSMRREILLDGDALNLVAYDSTHRDLVGFCNAGPSRREGTAVGELYEIYIVDRAKRFGLGRDMFESVTDWCRANRMSRMIVWVLEKNQHARRFYESMGGRAGARMSSTVRGYPVVELSYLWDRL